MFLFGSLYNCFFDSLFLAVCSSLFLMKLSLIRWSTFADQILIIIYLPSQLFLLLFIEIFQWLWFCSLNNLHNHIFSIQISLLFVHNNFTLPSTNKLDIPIIRYNFLIIGSLFLLILDLRISFLVLQRSLLISQRFWNLVLISFQDFKSIFSNYILAHNQYNTLF